jgi:anti-anti-sigma factor
VVEGELDLASAPDLERELRAAAGDAVPLVVVDLSEVTFVDSSALHMLVRTSLEVKTRGLDLVIRRPRGTARRVFDVVGLDRPLTLPEDDGSGAIGEHAAEPAYLSSLVALLEENTRLQQQLTSRTVIEQAKGVVAERLALDVDASLAVLRATARRSGRQLDDVAAAVVSGSERDLADP